jgi:hypothetical protein
MSIVYDIAAAGSWRMRGRSGGALPCESLSLSRSLVYLPALHAGFVWMTSFHHANPLLRDLSGLFEI